MQAQSWIPSSPLPTLRVVRASFGPKNTRHPPKPAAMGGAGGERDRAGRGGNGVGDSTMTTKTMISFGLMREDLVTAAGISCASSSNSWDMLEVR